MECLVSNLEMILKTCHNVNPEEDQACLTHIFLDIGIKICPYRHIAFCRIL